MNRPLSAIALWWYVSRQHILDIEMLQDQLLARVYYCGPMNSRPGLPLHLLIALLYCRKVPINWGKWRLARLLSARIPQTCGVVRTAYGFRMRLDTSDFVQRSIYISGTWDNDVARLIVAHLKQGDLFVDVGANIGFFSLLAASRGAEVIAFEPQTRCCTELYTNAKINGLQIDLRSIGLHSASGIVKLYIGSAGNLGSASLLSRGDELETVRVDTLDNQLSGRVPSLIKIDVEGAEIEVVRGARRVLSAPSGPPVIIEISEYSLQEMGGSKDELFEIMANYGYEAKIVSPVRRSNAQKNAIYFQYDALFVKVYAD